MRSEHLGIFLLSVSASAALLLGLYLAAASMLFALVVQQAANLSTTSIANVSNTTRWKSELVPTAYREAFATELLDFSKLVLERRFQPQSMTVVDGKCFIREFNKESKRLSGAVDGAISRAKQKGDAPVADELNRLRTELADMWARFGMDFDAYIDVLGLWRGVATDLRRSWFAGLLMLATLLGGLAAFTSTPSVGSSEVLNVAVALVAAVGLTVLVAAIAIRLMQLGVDFDSANGLSARAFRRLKRTRSD